MIDYVSKHYSDNKTDLFAIFIEKCGRMLKNNGYQAMITQHAWMFLSSFETLRSKLQNKTYINMAHLGARAFDEISGEVVQTTSFVLLNNKVNNYIGTFHRLLSATSEKGKEELFFERKNIYYSKQENYEYVPGCPIAYWLKSKFLDTFKNKTVSTLAKPRQGLATGDNDRFLRFWYEVDIKKICFDSKNREESILSGAKWFPCNKGGTYRKWYGNNDYIVNWENDGFEIRNNKDDKGKLRSRPQNMDFYFKEGITWSTIATKLSMRYSPSGHLFETKGSVCFTDKREDLLYLLGLMNTPIVAMVLSVLSPTLDYHEGPIGKIPVIVDDTRRKMIQDLVEQNVESCKQDWDAYSSSYDFKRHPLANGTSIREAFLSWEKCCKERRDKVKENEEAINRLFIEIYGLENDILPDVSEVDVSVNLANLERDVKSFVEYGVGCIFGRYSLKRDGIVCTSNEEKFDSDNIDDDNIIPITDEEYFDDDIVGLFVKFLIQTYGADNLEDNINFIASALHTKGNSSRECIRNYFVKDFFVDHTKQYQKRPIYWLFDSGKQNGFKALVYMHRYNADTIGNLRVDYLHRMERIYESEINRMQDTIDNSGNAREVTAASRRKEKLQKQLKECQEYDEKIGHLALSRIEIDLDDGVKVNYEKVQTANDGKKYQVLAKI